MHGTCLVLPFCRHVTMLQTFSVTCVMLTWRLSCGSAPAPDAAVKHTTTQVGRYPMLLKFVSVEAVFVCVVLFLWFKAVFGTIYRAMLLVVGFAYPFCSTLQAVCPCSRPCQPPKSLSSATPP